MHILQESEEETVLRKFKKVKKVFMGKIKNINDGKTKRNENIAVFASWLDSERQPLLRSPPMFPHLKKPTSHSSSPLYPLFSLISFFPLSLSNTREFFVLCCVVLFSQEKKINYRT